MKEAAKCSSCMSPINSHPETGCVPVEIDSNGLTFYGAAWKELGPLMTEKMVALAAALKSDDFEISDPVKSGPGEDMSSDINKVSIDIRRSGEDVVILSVDFEMIDGNDIGDGDGVAISCILDGYGNLAMGDYTPNNYSDGLYTTDMKDLRSRVELLDVDEMATYILNEVLTDESLLSAVANASAPSF